MAGKNPTAYGGGPSYTAAKFGEGLVFDGSSYYQYETSTGPFAFASGASFGISFWFNRASAPSDTRVLLSEGSETYVQIDNTGKVAMMLNPGSVISTVSICDGANHLVYFDYDGTNLRLYIDGTKIATSAVTSSLTGTGTQYVGNFTIGGCIPDAGWIDELAVFNVSRHTGASYIPETTHFLASTANLVALYHFNYLDSSTTPGRLNNGNDALSYTALSMSQNIQVTNPGPASVVMTQPFVGGQLPIASIAWYKSTTLSFTPGGGNILSNGGGISGSTTTTLTDATTLTAGTNYWYVMRVTDYDGNMLNAPYRLIRRAQPTSVKLAIIGDSTSTAVFAGLGASDFASAMLQGVLGVRNITLQNGAISGTKAQDWSSSSYAGYTALKAACGGSFTGWLVMVRIGVNDAQAATAAATFGGYMSSLVTNILADGGIPFLSYPDGREAGLFGQDGVQVFVGGCTELTFQYQAYIDALINGTTVIAGDRSSAFIYAELAQTYYYYAPGTATTTPGAIHPNGSGEALQGSNEAWAILSYLGLLSIFVGIKAPNGAISGNMQ